jgi:hypothetical protein
MNFKTSIVTVARAKFMTRIGLVSEIIEVIEDHDHLPFGDDTQTLLADGADLTPLIGQSRDRTNWIGCRSGMPSASGRVVG